MYVIYMDMITMKGKRARRICWAGGRRIPQLPVRVHIVAIRASGLVDLAIGEHIEVEAAWGRAERRRTACVEARRPDRHRRLATALIA